MNILSSLRIAFHRLHTGIGVTALGAMILLPTSPAARADSAYFIGNSVTDTVNYYGLVGLAESRGKTQPWARHMIPGAPLQILWENPTSGFTESPYGSPFNAFPNYTWDNVSLQPFDRHLAEELDYIQRYVGLLFGTASPTAAQVSNRLNTRILIYGNWPRKDDATYPGGPRSYDTLWNRTYTGGWDHSSESADYASDLTLAVRATSVSGVSMLNRTFMVPVGHVMYALNQQMKAGQIAGYTNIFQIYADNIHLNNVGAYLTACTYFTVLYGESPVGLPVPSQYGTIDPTLVAQIQATVWSVVQAEPLSGVSTANLLISSPAVSPGHLGQPYSASLIAAGGVAPRSFSVTAGALPAGITLASNGILSGTPTVQGNFTFTATVTDSTQPTALTAAREYNLNISVDTSPVITTAASLPAGSRGALYSQTLSATGGDGQISWTLTSGNLPPGIQLGAGGVLIGSALTEGDYTFTVRVDDGDIPADSDSRTFAVHIGTPLAETLLVSRTTSPIRVDGEFTETHWNLNSSAARELLGNPDNTTSFSVLWDADNLYLAARVMDSRLSAGGAGAERDAIEFFVDAYNDKQAIFNSQHRQFRVALDGTLFERGGRSTGVRQALLLVPGGYQLEMSIPWSNLDITPVAGETVIGLDLANDDSDTGASRENYTVFAFSDPDDPHPSQFGNAILTDNVVSGSGGEPLGSAGAVPVAHEPFDYTSGPLNNAIGTSSFGFGDTWKVQSNNTTGFVIEGAESLAYSALGTSGRYMSGGNVYLGSGRALDMTSAFLPWKRSGDNFVGKDGTTLWISYLVRPLASNSAMRFSLDDAGVVYLNDNDRLRVDRSGGVWRLSMMNGAVIVPTTVAASINTTYFIVIRLDFGATDTASLYVNPVLSASPPVSASAIATTTASNFRFSELQLYPGSGAGDGQFDEIRFGASWESVAPIPSLPVAPVSFSPLPGVFADAPTVSLNTATAAATIHYTTDGSAPTVASPVYSTALPLNATTTLRAFAVKSGSVAAAISGGTYAIQTPYQTWSGSIPWNGADSSPTADPNGDGISNLLAYALSGDPLDNASGSLPVAGTNDGLFTLTYLRARADVTYLVETSPTMATDSWTTVGVTQGSGDVGEMIIASMPTGSESRCFLRLHVTH